MNKFVTMKSLKRGDLLIELQTEVLPLTDYDMEGTLPAVRLKFSKETTCGFVDDVPGIIRISDEFGISAVDLARDDPELMAAAVAYFLDSHRPICNHPLFYGWAESVGVNLALLMPSIDDRGILTWYSIDSRANNGKFSQSTVSLART